MGRDLIVYEGPEQELLRKIEYQISLPFDYGPLRSGYDFVDFAGKVATERLQRGIFQENFKQEIYAKTTRPSKEWLVRSISEFKIEREILGGHFVRQNDWNWNSRYRSMLRGRREDQFIFSELRVGRATIALSVVFITLFAAGVALSSFSLVVDSGKADIFALLLTMAGATFGLFANNRAMRELDPSGKHR